MATSPIPGAERAQAARLRAGHLASHLTRVRVGTKLLLLATLPVCCVVALAVVSAVSDYHTADRLSRYRAEARLSFALTPLVVDLAHERRTAVLVRLDPGIAADPQLVAAERATTDAFEQARARAAHVGAPLDVAGDLDATRRQRQALVLELAARSLAPEQAIAGYSVITEDLLAVIGALDGGAPSPVSARAANAYGSILQAIESASRERVFVATFLAPRGAPAQPTADPWSELERAELNAFRQNAAGPLDSDLEAVLFSPTGTAVQRFRASLAANPAAAVRGTSLQQWLAVSGARIDALRGVAATAGRSLDAVVSDELGSAHARAVRDLALSLSALVLVTALALALRRSIARPLREVAAGARALARGDIAAGVEYSTRDEIGDVAAAFRSVHATAERLVDEIRAGNHAVRENQLEHRADVSGLEGVWSQLVAGMNDTMAAFADARKELRDFADEQAALRRVATLVAGGAAPRAAFAAVAEEVAKVLPGVELALLGRYTPDETIEFMGGWSSLAEPDWVGKAVRIGGHNASTAVFETAQPARVDHLEDDATALTAVARGTGSRSSAGAPIKVEGRLWGVMIVGSSHEDGLPVGIEHELAGFTELVATAIASADGRAELVAARRRVIEATDAARARLARDIHDGAQQRFLTALLDLQLALQKRSSDPDRSSALVDVAIAEVEAGVETLRELAAGVHPPILRQRGLTAALRALAGRMPIPLSLEVEELRLPQAVESSVYFFCSEALTNIVKHASAGAASLKVKASDGEVRVEVGDDGVGGAEIGGGGTGLIGLQDRIGALEGSFTVNTSAGGTGTKLVARIPLPGPGGSLVRRIPPL